jgi:nucleoside 2-deoxyribosyltransferase
MSNPTAVALNASWRSSAESVSYLQQMGLCYLATPYSKYSRGIVSAFEEAAALAGRLLKQGVKVYSPITHTHPIAHFGELNPLDHNIWLPFDQAMMEACDILVVAEMEGWAKSYGIAHEIEYFANADKPVVYLDPVRLVVRATPGAVSLRGEAA